MAVGERFYGYFPMASHLLVQAGKVKTHGFFDVMPHRANLPAIYNQYLNVQQDELYEAGKEAFQAIFRPLFTTSFLLEAFMVSHDFFGATQIVLTSASSKTAFALASLLKAYQKTSANPFKIVGLTSTNNEPFVAGLGCYDTLITYSNLPTLPQEKTVVIDFAGNQTLHYDLQAHIGDNLTYNCLVGAVHWDKGTADKMPPNKGKFFFAPTHAEQFLQTWGRDVFQKRLSEAWHSFATQASDWIHIEIAQDKNRLSEVYQTLLAGKYPAKNGFIFAH